jgi:hypothetical protein
MAKDHGWLRISLACAWIILLVVALLSYRPADRGGQLDQVAAQIRSQWRTGDQLVYATGTVGLPMEYYLGDLPHTWLDIIHNGLLVAGIPHQAKPCPQTCQRYWVVIPNDQNLITPAEWASLQPYMVSKPVYSVELMQAATINVYLENAK